MELVLARLARLGWQTPIHGRDDRVANRAFVQALELHLCIPLEQAQRIKDQSVLTRDQLLHGEQPGAPFALGNTDALDVTNLDTVEREVSGDLDANFHRMLVHHVGRDHLVRRENLDAERFVLKFGERFGLAQMREFAVGDDGRAVARSEAGDLH